jgi:predicted metal-dependent phosphoesterase TrpH
VLGLTDHDTVDGVAEAEERARELGIELIPGVELSTELDEHEVHILGYFVNPGNEELQRVLAGNAAERITRTERMLEALARLGMPIPFDEVARIAGEGTIGRPHVARAMLAHGYVTSIRDAFDRYLAIGQPGYVPRTRLTPSSAVRLLKRSGAVPVLAHPTYAGDYERIVEMLVPDGLLGLEVFYGDYPEDVREELLRVASRCTLVATGGSDYHGPGYREGRELGSSGVPPAQVERLRSAWKHLQDVGANPA